MNCNCKGGHQHIVGEVLAPPGLQAKGQDGEREVKVHQEEPEEPEAEEARTGRTDASTGFVPQSSL